MEKEDYILMTNIISTISSRGAFRADELYNVGALYNKLMTLINEQYAEEKVPEC